LGVGRRVYDTLDSTNAEAARLAPTATGPIWVMARTQTAGRGRRARAWVSPPGNLHATLLMHPGEAAPIVALRSFVAALALRDACAALTGAEPAFTLKWPNDVLLNGHKLAGILLERLSGAKGSAHLAIGFGVNLIAAPDPSLVEEGATPPISLLVGTGHRITPEAFLLALAQAYAAREATFLGEGFAPIRADWLTHAARLGEALTARTGTETLSGRFDGIDGSGALLLHTPTGLRTLPAADVFFPEV